MMAMGGGAFRIIQKNYEDGEDIANSKEYRKPSLFLTSLYCGLLEMNTLRISCTPSFSIISFARLHQSEEVGKGEGTPAPCQLSSLKQ